MRALLSVSNKAGIIDFARGLRALGVDLYSTGGTHKAIAEAGIEVHGISELTGFPEILDGRVKTLHPAVHGGILARRDLPEHMKAIQQAGIATIDLVVVNLYPFVQTVTKSGVTLEEAIENIDIGGPTMIRSAAKNYEAVTVVVDPEDYNWILQKMRERTLDSASRMKLAQKAYQHTASYDTAIARYLGEELFPEHMTLALEKAYGLRYGENPRQKACFYTLQDVKAKDRGLGALVQLNGPEISYNNLLDFDSAVSTLSEFERPTVAILKHTNPCGLASRDSLAEAYVLALSGDPAAAFGGVVACNRPIDLPMAEEINKSHYDAVIAPEFSADAVALLSQKKSLRLVTVPFPPASGEILEFRNVRGGFVVQTRDTIAADELTPKPASTREPTCAEMTDLLFAWRAVKAIKSNAIALAKDSVLVGMGAGQPSRVESVSIAIKKAGDRVKGAVLASDAFFPFGDGPELALDAGVTAFIQPGGSVRDDEVIEAVNRRGAAMVFTGMRHFKH
ncbi:MAG: bifunctional phosphoribosylaminoimidazolecarboxamide formyltransferase/IMP cyclohydrolase [Dehalococcoidia bacterium]|jgi:phosphoribosylaminoimidazolecarboxamide formyltransferase/IMP cyclohydrolase|nr:bifunctional phosphoribosylaminoimidazolecarboxamide formyltransferase/IMP cyclohydrolase [Dehalococcoidia bacterium]